MADDEPVASASGGKILGLRPRTAIIAGVIMLGGALAYLWWRNRQAASTGASSAPATGCTDGSGNAVPCPDSTGVDQSGELSVIQTELETLLQEEGNEPATGGGSTGGGSTGGGGTKTATKPATPVGITTSSVTKTGFRASWTKGPNATSYQWRVTYQGKLVGSGTVTGTSASVSGLSAGHTYTFHLKACNSGGCSAETNGPTVHTSK